MVCDACQENTRWRSSQSKLWRDSRVQRTTGWACWPTSLRWYLWMRLLRWYTWWHKPSGDSSASKQRLQRVPQCGESASSETMASFAWNFVSCYGLHQTILISEAHWDEGVENEQSSVLTYRLIEFLDDEPQLWSVPDIGKKILVTLTHISTQITMWRGHAAKVLMAATVHTKRQSKWTPWANGG